VISGVRSVCDNVLTVDGIENKLAATAFTADPAEQFGCGLQLFLDGIRQQLALLPSAAQAAARPAASRPGAPDGPRPGAPPAISELRQRLSRAGSMPLAIGSRGR
jgi:hypothetical protein